MFNVFGTLFNVIVILRWDCETYYQCFSDIHLHLAPRCSQLNKCLSYRL